MEQPATEPASAGALPRVVAIVAGVAVALVLVLSFIVLIGGYRWVPGVVDCTVGAGERTVELTSDDAEQAATVSARSVRRGLSAKASSTAVADALDLSDEEPGRRGRPDRARAHALTCTHGGADDEEPDRLDSAA